VESFRVFAPVRVRWSEQDLEERGCVLLGPHFAGEESEWGGLVFPVLPGSGLFDVVAAESSELLDRDETIVDEVDGAAGDDLAGVTGDEVAFDAFDSDFRVFAGDDVSEFVVPVFGGECPVDFQ